MYSLYNSVNLLSLQNNTQPLMSKPLATKVSTPLSENVQAIFSPRYHVTRKCYKVSGVLNLVLSLSFSYWSLEVQHGT